jgi:asparagine synthase (glutamine-hydrolysing)
MFAIAVWDREEQSLLLVRDRLGIKPLYYQTSNSRLLFASEARALPGAQQGFDEYALACYLHLGWVAGPRTAYRNICELPPGHRLRWQAGKIRLERWWEPPQNVQPTDREGLSEVLVDAVRRHLVADVPVGIFLSSGLDSAVIATLVAGLCNNVTAYTIAFSEGEDEAEGATALAARLGLCHEVVRVQGADVLASIEDFIGAMDQPTVDGLNTWVISRRVRSCGVVVALSGIGGDELFGGYSTYRHVPRLTSILTPSAIIPQTLRALPSAMLGQVSHSAHSRVRRVLDAARHPDPAALYGAVRGPMCPSEVERLRGGWGRDLRRRPPIATDSNPPTVRELEFEHYLPNQLLRDTDAMSMAHSLEVRVPLLDDEVVKTATAAEPPKLLGKQLLAASVDHRLLPIASSAKRTFTLPMDAWLRGPLHDWSADMLQTLALSGLGFDGRELQAFFGDFQARRAGWRGLWSLAVLGAWISGGRTRARQT